MTTILEKVEDLNRLILEGKFFEALEKHYHEDVVMRDNNLPSCIGKRANIEREKVMLQNTTEFKASKVLKVAVGVNISMVEWHLHFVHKILGEVNHNQIAVQEWQDGQIINEQFYYYE